MLTFEALRYWAAQNMLADLRLQDCFGTTLDRVDPAYLELFQDADPILADLNQGRKSFNALYLWCSVSRSQQS